MKYVLALVFALGLAIPSFAVELSLGGFPSFMRFRWRTLHNATYHNILTPGELANLGGGLDADTTGENLHFADMTLRLTPQLVLSDAVTIRASVDVLSNAIAGGATGGLFGEDSDGDKAGGVVQDDLRYTDRFNGTLLFGDEAVDANYGTFSVKFLHADINLGDKGFVRIGRQPFDFAMGLYANGGHDPYSDAGFNVDRLLWLKGYSTALGATTVVLVSDYIGGGSDSTVNLTQGTGITLTRNSATQITIDADNNGTVTSVGITDGYLMDTTGTNPITSSGSFTLDVDLSELTSMGDTLATTDACVILDTAETGKDQGKQITWAEVISDLNLTTGSHPTVSNATITLSAGNFISGGGDFTLNQSSNETITFNVDEGTSSAKGAVIVAGTDPISVAYSSGTCLLYTSPSPRD